MIYIDGFKYWLAYTKGDKSYYRCFRSKKMKCPGKVVMQSGKSKTVHEHSHEKETKISIVDKFRKVLTKKAVEKPSKPLVEIYLEETLNFTEASILYPFQSAESTMRKARVKHKPSLRKQNAIEDTEHQSELYLQLHKHFCHEVDQLGSTVIFMHQFSLKLLGKIEEIHVDCTISCSDETSQELFLITVLAITKSQDIPIAFGLVKSKSLEAFATFFAHIRNKAPTSLMPNSILTTCDFNLQNALQATFPEATIKVMWFFYASSVLNFAKERGILKTMKQSLFHLSSLKMILALPLIPANYMIPGHDALKNWMSEKSVNFDGLGEFIDGTWLTCDGAEKISIFNGLSHSINNYVQIFNQTLLQGQNADTLKKGHLMEAINKQACKATAKVKKLKSSPTLKKSQKLQKKVLETATNNWIKANIHLRRPIQFLQQVSHCFDDSMINFLINYELGERKLEEPQESFLDFTSNSSPGTSVSTEPPPLIYYRPAVVATALKPSISEPPPLVPILSKNNLAQAS